jgi:hypothetical protein
MRNEGFLVLKDERAVGPFALLLLRFLVLVAAFSIVVAVAITITIATPLPIISIVAVAVALTVTAIIVITASTTSCTAATTAPLVAVVVVALAFAFSFVGEELVNLIVQVAVGVRVVALDVAFVRLVVAARGCRCAVGHVVLDLCGRASTPTAGCAAPAIVWELVTGAVVCVAAGGVAALAA